ncbi:MAG: glycosyltransferase family 2 protein [Chloroflexi bacterium]|nr:glycosyltransferase family 2 protein [Chloroflexota bacterium]
MFDIRLPVEIALSVLQIILLIGLAYHYLLLVASLPQPTQRLRGAAPAKIFAIAIPAHNEASVIGKTVSCLAQQDYPSGLYDVYVAADYCTDNTAQLARNAGAICRERNEGPRGRKAYPLQWLLQQIVHGARPYDAIAIFDADSQVDAGFLRTMETELQAGHTALQGQHLIVNPGDSSLSRLAAIDMRLNNLLRNRSKRNLNLSSRLMGDAMCLSSDLIRAHGWGGESLAEDREFEMYLLLQGQRVRYVPEAMSYGQAVAKWSDASKQRVRWYGGVFDLQKKFAGRLLRRGLQKRDLAVLDRAIELLLPSFSTLSVATIGLLLVQLLWPGLNLLLSAWAMLVSALAWVAFPVAGLIIDRSPAWTYKALLHAPIYILWRISQGLQATFKRGRVDWVRTRRREE